MKTEFEVKILDIKEDEIVAKLNKLGAVKIGEKLQKRYIYEFNPKKEGSWLRLRTNGETTTLTIKEITTDKIDGTKELEITVSDFELTDQMLERLGYKHQFHQENKRISYLLDDVQIEIDTWPQIPTYLEIEASDQAKVEATIIKLGYEISQATSISTEKVYQKYGLDINSFKELKF